MLRGVPLQTTATSAALPIALVSYICQIVPDGNSLAPASCSMRPTRGNTRNVVAVLQSPRLIWKRRSDWWHATILHTNTRTPVSRRVERHERKCGDEDWGYGAHDRAQTGDTAGRVGDGEDCHCTRALARAFSVLLGSGSPERCARESSSPRPSSAHNSRGFEGP